MHYKQKLRALKFVNETECSLDFEAFCIVFHHMKNKTQQYFIIISYSKISINIFYK